MGKRVLVTGATGQLGAYLIRELVGCARDVVAWSHSSGAPIFGVTPRPVELADSATVSQAFRDARPEVVIHAAAMASVAECARDPARAQAINTSAAEIIADLCDAAGARLVAISTDLVFDGEQAPYAESDLVAPLSVYGRTKAAGELAVLARRRHAIVRVSWMFGPSLIERKNFFDDQLAALRGGPPVTVFHDEWRTPLGLPTAARALIEIADSDVAGLIHVGGPERMSRLEIGQRLAAHLGTGTGGLVPASRVDVAGEPRPRDVSLNSTCWRRSFPHQRYPTFEEALVEMGVR
jgi:dTDP-4-dehydrorhamnose reductase